MDSPEPLLCNYRLATNGKKCLKPAQYKHLDYYLCDNCRQFVVDRLRKLGLQVLNSQEECEEAADLVLIEIR